MKLMRLSLMLALKLSLSLSLLALLSSIQATGTRASFGARPLLSQATNAEGKLVYADFETIKDNRAVSNRGGLIQLFAYQESPSLQATFKGMAGANPPAPDLVRLRKDDPNRAISFEYTLPAPNQYAGVTVEIHGQADRDGKTVADDVSGYKYLTFQAYATGVQDLRVEIVSKGQGVTTNGYPQMVFKVSPGFNTYKIPLKSLAQPSWAQRISEKDVMKKLTSVNISAYCDRCKQVTGTVVLDNLAFQN
jgi:hypothetical protein